MSAPTLVLPIGRAGWITEVFPISVPLTVSLPVTFLMPSDFHLFDQLLFGVRNLDSTNALTVFFEPMDDSGVYPNTGLHGGSADPLVIRPGETADLDTGDKLLRYVWTGQAMTSGPGFPSVNMQWWVRGVSRLT